MSLSDGGWIRTTRSCDELGCVEGANIYNDDEPCGKCLGRGEIEIEVHEKCGKDEKSCPCFEAVAVKPSAAERQVAA